MVLRVEREGLPNLYSIVSSADETLKIANIHPYTDIIVRNWFAIQGLDIDTEFDSDAPISLLPTPEQVAEIEEAIINLISVALIQFQVPLDFNLLSTVFDADQTGFDSFLDFSRVTIDNNLLQIILIDIIDPTRTTTIVSVNIDDDLTEADTTNPSTPQNVRANPDNETQIDLVWEPSTDNIGVAGYEIFREGETEPFVTTPYPVYTDTGLIASTEYCYFVDAVDGAGNRSTRAATATCGTTDPGVDNTAPEQVQGAVIDSVTVSSITLSWTASAATDLVGYYVSRWNGSSYDQVGNVSTNSFTDSSLNASTEYCYVVTAYDEVPNISVNSEQVCSTTDIYIEPDTTPPVVTATPLSGDYTSAQSVTLSCSDGINGSGCAGTYYTLDGSVPTTSSTLYSSAIVISETTTLRFTALDNAGNEMDPLGSETYNINLPTTQQLTVVSSDVNGTIVSDIAGIDCGTTCSASFTSNSEITLTASHTGGLVPVWSGCTSVVANDCIVQLNQDLTINVSFVAQVTEVEPNDTFATAQAIAGASIATGYFNALDDYDYYTFQVNSTGTFFASISHSTGRSNIYLYNNQFTQLAYSGGVNGGINHTVAWSLTPGTYYVMVRSRNAGDLVEPYMLSLSGTVLGTDSPDAYEENDSFATAQLISNSGPIEGYLDTWNDNDYFRFVVTDRGTFYTAISHPTGRSNVYLLNDQFAQLTYSGGVNGATAHTIAWSLDPGTYYVQVRSRSVSDLNTAYSLAFSGTVFGDPTPDAYEENDSFTTAQLISSSGSIDGYMDTWNDNDYFRFVVSERGTFYTAISHPTGRSNVYLLNDQFTQLTYSGGVNGATTHTIAWSLDPGTYYVQVRSRSVSDLNTAYNLSITGTVFGDASPDAYEQNDSIAFATGITDNASYQAYLDTWIDDDYYAITVTTPGLLEVSIAHGGAPSNLYLYDSGETQLTYSGGVNGATSHTLTYDIVTTGTYYIRVRSRNSYDLGSPYTLSLPAIQ